MTVRDDLAAFSLKGCPRLCGWEALCFETDELEHLAQASRKCIPPNPLRLARLLPVPDAEYAANYDQSRTAIQLCLRERPGAFDWRRRRVKAKEISAALEGCSDEFVGHITQFLEWLVNRGHKQYLRAVQLFYTAWVPRGGPSHLAGRYAGMRGGDAARLAAKDVGCLFGTMRRDAWCYLALYVNAVLKRKRPLRSKACGKRATEINTIALARRPTTSGRDASPDLDYIRALHDRLVDRRARYARWTDAYGEALRIIAQIDDSPKWARNAGAQRVFWLALAFHAVTQLAALPPDVPIGSVYIEYADGDGERSRKRRRRHVSLETQLYDVEPPDAATLVKQLGFA